MEEIKNTILIIYDDDTDIALLKHIFQKDYHTVEAQTAEQIMETMRSHPEIALVVLKYSKLQAVVAGKKGEEQRKKFFGSTPIIVVADNGDVDGQIVALDNGAEDVICTPFNSRMILHRVQNIIERRKAAEQAEHNRLVGLRLKQRDELQKLYETDEKTGIYNRRAFCEHVRMLFRENPDKKYVIFQWDVDRFKVFNDMFGINAGDEFLAAVGRAFENTRGIVDVYGRWDADDFVCCMEKDCFYPEKIVDQITKFVTTLHDKFEFIVRMGIYVVEDPTLDIELMCDRAQLAMRSTKTDFGKRFAYYEDNMRNQLIEEQMIISEMSTALASGQFSVYFQPQYNHSDGSLYGAEALVRWIHPTRGVIPPMKFVPLFERNGFISKLDEYVWDRTCAHLRAWLDAGIKVPPVSVNISRCDIYNPNLSDCLMGIIKKYDLDVSMLRLEITETVYMESPQILLDAVRKLCAMGFFLEMDDFGSGYSSLNTLKDVPVDMLKLDLKFVKRTDDERGGRILSSIIRMAHWIKLQVIAEGVETKAQADYLKSMGCTLMQGYYFAKPMPADAFEILLRNSLRDEGDSDFGGDTDVKGAADFLDASMQTALLFNSFVGGAAIIEYDGQTAEALRINDKYFEVVNSTRERYCSVQIDLLARFDEPYRSSLKEMLDSAIQTGGEAESEALTRPLGDDRPPIWLKVRVRYLYKNMDSYIFYVSIENITQRVELTEKNRDLTQQLTSVIANVPGGIFSFVYDKDGMRMTYFNDNAAAMFGYSRQEFQEIFADDPAVAFSPEDAESVLGQIRQTIEGKKPLLRLRYRTLHKDGAYRWIQLNGHLLYGSDGVVNASAIIMDIDEQVENELLNKRQAAQLDQQKLFLDTLYNNIPCGIMRFSITPEKRELISYNETAWRILGFESKEDFLYSVKGCNGELANVKSFYPEDTQLVLEKTERAVKTTERVDFDFRTVRGDGSISWVRTILQKTSANDGTEIIQGVLTDINEQKICEIQRYSSALFGAYDEIYEFNFEKNECVLRSSKKAPADIIGKVFDLERWLDSHCEKYIMPEYRQGLRQFLDVSGKDFRSRSMQLKYKLPGEEAVRWGEATILHVEADSYLLCNRDISAQKSADMLASENKTLRAAAMQHRAEDERNRAFVEAMAVAILDYDTQNDCLYAHVKTEQGKFNDIKIENYSSYILTDRRIADEDRSRAIECIMSAKKKPSSGSIEYLGNIFDRGFCPCIFEYISLADSNGKVYRVIGMVRNAFEISRRWEALCENDSTNAERERETLPAAAIPAEGLAADACERFRILAEQTGTVLVDHDLKTGETFCSDAYSRYALSSLNLTEIQSKAGKMDIAHPDDIMKLDELVKAVTETGKAEAILRLRLVSGGYSWTKVGVISVNDAGGNRERIFCTLTDYDEQIDLQHKLEAMNERTNSIIANVPSGIAIFEIDEWVKPIFVSDRTCEMFGYSREEYDRRIAEGTPVNFVPDISELPENTLDYIASGKPFDIPKLRARRKSGGRFWLRVLCSTKMKPDGVCICYTTLSDISEQVKKDEKAMWQAERYKLLSEAGNTVTFDYDPERDILELSYNDPGKGMISRILENHLQELDENENVSADCRPAYKNAIIRMSQNQGEGIFDIKAQINDKAMRWYRANYVSVGDSSGRVVRIVGRIDDINDMITEQDEIRKKAMIDGLTGLQNKQTAYSAVNYLLRKRRPSSNDAMMVLDIDGFKSINDTQGHMEGDRVLEKVGEILKRQFRSNDVVGRFGGDEFVVYMQAVGSVEVAEAKAESLVREIGAIEVKNGRHISCSIGVTFISGNKNQDFEQAFRQADYALYVAKNNGKNQYTLFDHATMGTEISSIGKWREN
ncbi:MAG: EAL domain-containing protein [Clostridia bacterium]|nr:EAL domain-containing protein [Clostridia bacterium]